MGGLQSPQNPTPLRCGNKAIKKNKKYLTYKYIYSILYNKHLRNSGKCLWIGWMTSNPNGVWNSFNLVEVGSTTPLRGGVVHMTTSVLTVRLDSNDKNTFASMCKDLGISTSTAINMLVRDCIRKQSILGLDCNISEEVDENGFTKEFKESLDKSIEQLEQGKVVKCVFE